MGANIKVVHGYRALDTGSAAISDMIKSVSANIESASSTLYFVLLDINFGLNGRIGTFNMDNGNILDVEVAAFYCN